MLVNSVAKFRVSVDALAVFGCVMRRPSHFVVVLMMTIARETKLEFRFCKSDAAIYFRALHSQGSSRLDAQCLTYETRPPIRSRSHPFRHLVIRKCSPFFHVCTADTVMEWSLMMIYENSSLKSVSGCWFYVFFLSRGPCEY